MNHKRIVIALAVFMIALTSVSIIGSEESDAWVSIEDGIRGEGFSTNSGGTLIIPIANTEDTPVTLTRIIVKENGEEVHRAYNVVVPAGGGEVRLSFTLHGAGEHLLTITGEPSSLFYPNTDKNTAVVKVTESVLSKPTTYIAIAVIAILIVIAFYMHLRNAPTKKPDTTFTELERQKRESREEEVVSTRKSSATEVKRYDKASSEPQRPPEEKKTFTELHKEKNAGKEQKPQKEKEKKAPAFAGLKREKSEPKEKKPAAQKKEPEKKAASFTELEKEKSQKKEASATQKKESSSDEPPKKLKYVSSRRK